MVTGLIKLNGMTVGAVANCSEVYDAEGKKAESFDKSLTAQGCNKAAEFVQFCDAFSIPVLTITNVNGLKNCMCSEKKLAKALARMTYAFSNATCAKVNLITGEAYGSAYVFMNSKSRRSRSCIRMERSKDRCDGFYSGCKDYVSGSWCR